MGGAASSEEPPESRYRPGYEGPTALSINTGIHSDFSAGSDLSPSPAAEAEKVKGAAKPRRKLTLAQRRQQLIEGVREKNASERQQRTPKAETEDDKLVQRWSNIMKKNKTVSNKDYLIQAMEIEKPCARKATTSSITVGWQHVRQGGQARVQRYELRWRLSEEVLVRSLRADVVTDTGEEIEVRCTKEYSELPEEAVDAYSGSFFVDGLSGLCCPVLFKVSFRFMVALNHGTFRLLRGIALTVMEKDTTARSLYELTQFSLKRFGPILVQDGVLGVKNLILSVTSHRHFQHL